MTRPDVSRGVFETLLVRDGRAQALNAHLARLAASVSELYAEPLPPGVPHEILSAARSLTGDHRLRIDVLPHAGEAHLSMTTSRLAEPRGSAATIVPVTISGGLGPHKWCDRRHLDALAERAAPDGVVVIADDDGQALEAAWANVWLLEDDRLRTPPADGRILPGVTRSRLLSLAASLGLQSDEAPISLAELQRAPAAFLTSSLRVTALAPTSSSRAPADPRIAAVAGALATGDWT